jgi:hypothetical protein
MKDFLLVLSALVTIAAVVPYIRDILKGKTKPNIVSWITWTLLTGLATAALISAHEYRAAFFTGSAMVETAAVVILGLRYGYVKYTRFDVICQIAAVVGLILWQIFSTPLIAVFAAVTIDLIGALPTFKHSWQKPLEETWVTYAWSGVGAFIALFALESYNWTSLSYPVYIVLVNIFMSATILVARQRVHGHQTRVAQ